MSKEATDLITRRKEEERLGLSVSCGLSRRVGLVRDHLRVRMFKNGSREPACLRLKIDYMYFD
jgi:hypothetical protein